MTKTHDKTVEKKCHALIAGHVAYFIVLLTSSAVAERCCTAASPKLTTVTASFQRSSLLSCLVDGYPASNSSCRWLDVTTDRVVSNSSQLDICSMSLTTSPRDLRCVVTVNVHGQEFDVAGNVSADLTLWAIVRNSCDNSSTGI